MTIISLVVNAPLIRSVNEKIGNEVLPQHQLWLFIASIYLRSQWCLIHLKCEYWNSLPKQITAGDQSYHSVLGEIMAHCQIKTFIIQKLESWIKDMNVLLFKVLYGFLIYYYKCNYILITIIKGIIENVSIAIWGPYNSLIYWSIRSEGKPCSWQTITLVPLNFTVELQLDGKVCLPQCGLSF